MNIQTAKQIDIIEFLKSIGYTPIKTRGNDYWYLSPLRDEKTASFHANRKFNLWYDFGIGKGGDIIDFGVAYYHCSVTEFLNILRSKDFSFHPQNEQKQKPVTENEPAFKAISIDDIQNHQIVKYIESRAIKLDIAKQFCKEVIIEHNNTKKHYALLGLPNHSNGWELNAPNFKTCIKPKNFSFVDSNLEAVAITEGLFDFLSAFQEQKGLLPEPTNWLTLNSLALFPKAQTTILQHKRVYLLLDTDDAAATATKLIRKICADNDIQAEDISYKYEKYNDLNEWLVKERNSFHQNINTKRSNSEAENQQQDQERRRGFRR